VSQTLPRAGLGSAGGWLVPLLLGLLVSLPALGGGLLLDDLFYLLAVERGAEGRDPVPFGLYDFTRGEESPERWRDLSYAPWWTSEDFSLRFFRPLSSLLLSADLKFFKERLWVAHLHSITWFLALVSVVISLHRRLADARTARLASVIYALAIAHLAPTGWLSARHTLVAAVFGLLALDLHLRGREGENGARLARLVAPILVVLSMLCSELSLAALAFIFSYELFGRSDPLRRRFLALAPYTVLAGAYLIFYVSAGYGARGTGLYVSPVTEPARFFAAALLRVPILLGELIAATPAMISATRPVDQPAFAVWGSIAALIAASALFVLWRRIDPGERRALRWLLPGTLVSSLPGASGVLGGRALLPALVTSSFLISLFIRRGAASARRSVRSPALRAVLWSVVALLVFTHMVLAPVFRVGVTILWGRISSETERIAAAAPDCGPRYVLIAAADPTVVTYVKVIMFFDRSIERFRVVSPAANDHRLEEVTATGFDLVVVGERRPNFWERVHRNKPLRAGEVISLSDIRLEVLDAAPSGPTHVRVDLDRPLDDPELCLLVWRGGKLERLDPPVPGDVLELPHEPGPMGL
jgi:hypothetical protein